MLLYRERWEREKKVHRLLRTQEGRKMKGQEINRSVLGGTGRGGPSGGCMLGQCGVVPAAVAWGWQTTVRRPLPGRCPAAGGASRQLPLPWSESRGQTHGTLYTTTRMATHTATNTGHPCHTIHPGGWYVWRHSKSSLVRTIKYLN